MDHELDLSQQCDVAARKVGACLGCRSGGRVQHVSRDSSTSLCHSQALHGLLLDSTLGTWVFLEENNAELEQVWRVVVEEVAWPGSWSCETLIKGLGVSGLE